MKVENNIIYADEVKLLQRKSDKTIFGKEVHLGYTWVINNEYLDFPLLELPEHYEEVDEVITEETILLNEEIELVEEIPVETKRIETLKPRKVTIGDYLKLEDEFREIKRILGLN